MLFIILVFFRAPSSAATPADTASLVG